VWFVRDPIYVGAILLLLVALSEWLCAKRFFRYLGSALTVIIAAAILANIGVIPSSSNAPLLYDGIFGYVAPLAIFFLLLDVRLRDLRFAGLPMLVLFGLGAAATMAGAIISYHLLAPPAHGIPQGFAIAGMFTGTYIGGSINLNAVALHYGVGKDGTLFAAINAADNVITTLWIVATLLLPRLLQRWLPRTVAASGAAARNGVPVNPLETKEQIDVLSLSLLIALGLACLFLSQLCSNYLPALPAILVLTTLALVLAQIPAVQKLRGAKTLGYLAVALLLLKWVTLIVAIHAVLLFGLGGLFKQDWAMVSIASNANVGGAATAGVLATALGRDELRLPGILVGSVGNAIGTYAGILVAELLR
jgi:uncharacterized membrane protein